MYYFIITGKQTSYSGWKSEYTGYPMTEYTCHNNTDHACVDKDVEPIESDTLSKDGALFYPVTTTCDSLRYPPYQNYI